MDSGLGGYLDIHFIIITKLIIPLRGTLHNDKRLTNRRYIRSIFK